MRASAIGRVWAGKNLEQRRLRGDLIEMYKVIRRIDRVTAQNLFLKLRESQIIKHRFTMKGRRFNRNQKDNTEIGPSA